MSSAVSSPVSSVVPALAAPAPGATFEQTTVERREVGPHDVRLDVAFCGVCHSDIHQVRDEWASGLFPMVPGHEIAGTVAEVGSGVAAGDGAFRVGDPVGVGCFVDSCRTCEACLAGEEQYCLEGMVETYGGRDRDGAQTYGGYSTSFVVDADYLLRIPDALALDVAAPLLCAGITTYSPLRRWGVGPGSRVAVVGLGGLGHLGVRIAAAMGAEVTVLSQTASKEQDARRLGATRYVATTDPSDPTALDTLAGSFDLVLNTVSAPLPLDRYLRTLRRDGAMVNVGIPTEPLGVSAMTLVEMRRTLTGSNIGGIRETQEMLDFCAEHGISAEVEVVPAEPAAVDRAFERVVASDVRYRFVLDLGALR